jgi:hypothetical protein
MWIRWIQIQIRIRIRNSGLLHFTLDTGFHVNTAQCTISIPLSSSPSKLHGQATMLDCLSLSMYVSLALLSYSDKHLSCYLYYKYSTL